MGENRNLGNIFDNSHHNLQRATIKIEMTNYQKNNLLQVNIINFGPNVHMSHQIVSNFQ